MAPRLRPVEGPVRAARPGLPCPHPRRPAAAPPLLRAQEKGPQAPLGSQEPIFIPVRTLESFLEASEDARGCAGPPASRRPGRELKGLALRDAGLPGNPAQPRNWGRCREWRVPLTNGATGHAGQDSERGRAVGQGTRGPQEGPVVTAYEAEGLAQRSWTHRWPATVPSQPQPPRRPADCWEGRPGGLGRLSALPP